MFPLYNLSIERLDQNTNIPLAGVSNNRCWLFKVVKGKISIYSFLSETDITTDYLTTLQVDDGPIEPFNKEKLNLIILDDEKAMKAYEKKIITWRL